jgi:hypothetical protein
MTVESDCTPGKGSRWHKTFLEIPWYETAVNGYPIAASLGFFCYI